MSSHGNSTPNDTGVFVYDKALQDLAQAARSVDEAREQERRTLARELHDRVVQPLVALVASIDVLPQQLSNVDPLQDWILTSKELAREALGALRDVVAGLRTHPYEMQGLPDALRVYLAPLFQTRGVRLIVESQDWPDNLPSDYTFHVYLMVREAAINAEKHGHASEIRVLLWADAERLRLIISDNGVGIQQSAHPNAITELPGNGLGIASMRDRAGLLGGELSLDSAPGKGVRVTITVPRPPHSGNALDSPPSLSPN